MFMRQTITIIENHLVTYMNLQRKHNSHQRHSHYHARLQNRSATKNGLQTPTLTTPYLWATRKWLFAPRCAPTFFKNTYLNLEIPVYQPHHDPVSNVLSQRHAAVSNVNTMYACCNDPKRRKNQGSTPTPLQQKRKDSRNFRTSPSW